MWNKWRHANPQIDDAQTLRRRDDRIEIDLDDLRNSVGKLAETNEESFEGGMIRHRRSAVAVEER